MPKLCIFDLDGTLIDSMPATIHSFIEAISELKGSRVTIKDLEPHWGPPEQELIERALGYELGSPAGRRAYEKYLDYFRPQVPTIQFFDGASEMLDGLKNAGVHIALFTGRSREATEVIFNELSLSSRFEAIVCGDDLPRSKPEPDGILKIIDEFTLRHQKKPKDVYYVGDSPIDQEAARRANVFSIASRWHDRSLPQRTADFVVDHPKDLLRVVL